MSYIGIDQSYSGFGITIIDGIGYHTSLGKFDPGKYHCQADRLAVIQDWVVDVISEHGLLPRIICMEGYAAGAKFGRELAGELGGAVKLALWTEWSHIPVLVPPTSLKKFATGSGAAKKNEILLNVYKRWGVELKDDNVADSYILARIAEAIDTDSADLPKFQQEVLSKLGS